MRSKINILVNHLGFCGTKTLNYSLNILFWKAFYCSNICKCIYYDVQHTTTFGYFDTHTDCKYVMFCEQETYGKVMWAVLTGLFKQINDNSILTKGELVYRTAIQMKDVKRALTNVWEEAKSFRISNEVHMVSLRVFYLILYYYLFLFPTGFDESFFYWIWYCIRCYVFFISNLLFLLSFL